MSASGPVQNPKTFPAAVMDDQQELEEGNVEPIVLGTVPFSSPDPVTDAKKMLPLEDGTSAYEAREDAAQQREMSDVSKMKKDELVARAEEMGLDSSGTKDELVARISEEQASDMKASDFKDRVNAANSQDELDEAAEFYANSGKEYASVASAIERRQAEINEQQ